MTVFLSYNFSLWFVSCMKEILKHMFTPTLLVLSCRGSNDLDILELQHSDMYRPVIGQTVGLDYCILYFIGRGAWL